MSIFVPGRKDVKLAGAANRPAVSLSRRQVKLLDFRVPLGPGNAGIAVLSIENQSLYLKTTDTIYEDLQRNL
jgi:hypothetical protein